MNSYCIIDSIISIIPKATREHEIVPLHTHRLQCFYKEKSWSCQSSVRPKSLHTIHVGNKSLPYTIVLVSNFSHQALPGFYIRPQLDSRTYIHHPYTFALHTCTVNMFYSSQMKQRRKHTTVHGSQGSDRLSLDLVCSVLCSFRPSSTVTISVGGKMTCRGLKPVR
jgi:hypothetical protein